MSTNRLCKTFCIRQFDKINLPRKLVDYFRQLSGCGYFNLWYIWGVLCILVKNVTIFGIGSSPDRSMIRWLVWVFGFRGVHYLNLNHCILFWYYSMILYTGDLTYRNVENTHYVKGYSPQIELCTVTSQY